jgi:HK97 family phage prohead protease
MNTTKIYKTTTSALAAGKLNFILSDPSEDAYNDIVGDPKHPTLGWDYTSVFEPNPVALLGHKSEAPIGVWENTHVAGGALRASLRLAPPGSTRIVDETRALLEAGVLRGVSVGFRPTQSVPRPGGIGIHYQRMVLCEASVCAIPANPQALLQAQAMGISRETIQRVFKTEESVGERIRSTRRVIAKLKARLATETRPHYRAILMKSITLLGREETERLLATTIELERAKLTQQMEENATALEVSRLVREEMKSASWQKKRQNAEIIAGFTRTAMNLPQDPPPSAPSGHSHGTWRGQKLPGPTWRGKPIR